MRSVQGIADQDHVAKVPTIIPQPREIAPDRFVGNKRVAVKRAGEHFFADGLRLLDGLAGKSVALPGLPIAFDQERAELGQYR